MRRGARHSPSQHHANAKPAKGKRPARRGPWEKAESAHGLNPVQLVGLSRPGYQPTCVKTLRNGDRVQLRLVRLKLGG